MRWVKREELIILFASPLPFLFLSPQDIKSPSSWKTSSNIVLSSWAHSLNFFLIMNTPSVTLWWVIHFVISEYFVLNLTLTMSSVGATCSLTDSSTAITEVKFFEIFICFTDITSSTLLIYLIISDTIAWFWFVKTVMLHNLSIANFWIRVSIELFFIVVMTSGFFLMWILVRFLTEPLDLSLSSLSFALTFWIVSFYDVDLNDSEFHFCFLLAGPLKLFLIFKVWCFVLLNIIFTLNFWCGLVVSGKAGLLISSSNSPFSHFWVALNSLLFFAFDVSQTLIRSPHIWNISWSFIK